MKTPLSLFSLAIAAYSFSNGAYAADSDFYSRKAEGWFFYNEIEPAPEPDHEKSDETQKPPKSEDPPAEPIAAQPSGPAPMSAAWIKENLPVYLNKALDNPTQENVKAYLYLQKLSVDKADRFAQMTERVRMSDPLLDENIRRPLSTAGSRALDAKANTETNAILELIAQKAGIVMFYRSDCGYCSQEVPVLKGLTSNYGYKVRAVSLDGLPLPGNPYPDFKVNEGQAERLGVTVTPTTYLVSKNGFQLIGQGLLTTAAIKQRITYAALEAGLIDESDFNRTRPVENQDTVFITDATPVSDSSQEQPDFSDPQVLINYLRSAR